MKRDELLTRLENSMLVIGKGMHEEQTGRSGKSSPAQNHALMMICLQGDMSIKQLADTLYVTSGAATQHVDALEKAGLLSRETNSANRREVIIKVTEQGKAAFREIRQAKTKALGKLFGDLDDTELQTLVNLIEKVSRKYVNGKGGSHGKVQ